MKRLFVSLCLIVFISLPAAADTLIRTRTTSGGDRANDQMDMVADVYTDGTQVQVHFRESSNPFMKQGQYLYSPDGGSTLYLVDPEEKTYSEWDLEAILRFAGSVLRGMGPLLKLEIREPRVELVSDGQGPAVLGLPTHEYNFESRYTIFMRILGMKREQLIADKTRILTTKALPDVALSVWLRKDPPKTGNEDLDQLAESTWKRTEGVVVGWRTDTLVTAKKGKQERSWSEFEALEIDRSSGGPPNGYGFPDSYTRVSLMPTEAEMAGGTEEEEGEKKGRFGGLLGGKKD